MAETVKQTVGEGTEAQIVITMLPLSGGGTSMSLSQLDWSCSFEGNKGKFIVAKDNATMINENSYECIVDTSVTGKSSDIKAVLTVEGIPTTNNNYRREVTPAISTNLEVV